MIFCATPSRVKPPPFLITQLLPQQDLPRFGSLESQHNALECLLSTALVCRCVALRSAARRDRARDGQRAALIELRGIEAALRFIGSGNLHKLTATYHLFDIAEPLWSALFRKLPDDCRTKLTVAMGCPWGRPVLF
jgi:hypothetical protein